ncbi:MAG: AzlC family ABC transporter permease [Clostridiales bacterium]|nr:AzlC family ABC transporter permease [Clostridiales bacterium]
MQVEEKELCCNSFLKGMRDGVPIGLGYLSVSITFGMMACGTGMPVWAAVLISMTNLTSAGQFAGLPLMLGGSGLFEMALAQLVINIRYSVMSFSLTQKLHKSVTLSKRLLIAFFNTDEIFAVASGQRGEVGARYMYGLAVVPYIGWTLGTLLGGVAANVLPDFLVSAFGIAIYGMFIAIFVPPAKKSRAVFTVVLIAAALSCVFRWLPALAGFPSGFAIIICAIAASVSGALIAPIGEEAVHSA